MTVKYQVFISSTFTDLKEERKLITEAVLDLDQIPSGMELFPASDESQFDYISKVIDECDYYVLVIGGRYGSVDANGLSYTEKEYDYAIAKKKTVLAFLHHDISKLLASQVEAKPSAIQKLENFRKKAEAGRLVKYWTDKIDLKTKVTASLAIAINRFPGVGWIRGDAAASADLLRQLNDVRVENEKLKTEKATVPRPKIDNIAGLDEHFRIVFAHSVYYGDSQKKYRTFTWLDIFKIVAPACMTPADGSIVGVRLSKYLEDELGGGDVTIPEDAVTTIKLQLDALDLIKYSASRAASGSKRLYLQTSDKGKALLYDTFVIRSKIDKNDS